MNKLRKKILCALLVAAVLTPVCAAMAGPPAIAAPLANRKTKAVAQYGPGKVYKATDLLNLRKGPSRNSDVITTLNKGEAFTLISKHSAKWFKVRSKFGRVGYVDTKYIRYDKSIAPKGLGPGRIFMVTGDYLRLRAHAKGNGDVIVRMRRGDLVTSVGNAPRGWVKVRTKDGHTGYAWGTYLKYRYTVAK